MGPVHWTNRCFAIWPLNHFSLGKQVGLEQAWCHGPLAFFPFARALNGDVRHIEELYKLLGVRRMQLNPTKAALE